MRKLLQSRNPDVRLWLLLGLWWIANLIQAGCTELANDEAYYHMFSRSLAWGYFDHPPMTALLVRLGSFWGGEFGVRFFFTLLQPLYLYLLWRIVRPDSATVRDAGLFVLIAAAMPILQLYGFLAVPDGPLMLFTALFLWCYKRLTEDDRWSHALWLGVAMAALAYSKYHGALVVLLTVLSNLRLLRNPKFYAACVVTLLLILPHLGWQSGHDWVSFRYHLAGRNKDFQFSFVTEYLLNLLAIFNPLLFPVFVAVWWKTRAETPVLRALNFISAGFVLFFLSTTLRGYVQPQWEIPVAFGVIALLFLHARRGGRPRRYVVRVGWVTVALVALVRIEMIFNPLGLRFEVFDNRTSYGRIAQEAAGAPVIFDGQICLLYGRTGVCPAVDLLPDEPVRAARRRRPDGRRPRADSGVGQRAGLARRSVAERPDVPLSALRTVRSGAPHRGRDRSATLRGPAGRHASSESDAAQSLSLRLPFRRRLGEGRHRVAQPERDDPSLRFA